MTPEALTQLLLDLAWYDLMRDAAHREAERILAQYTMTHRVREEEPAACQPTPTESP